MYNAPADDKQIIAANESVQEKSSSRFRQALRANARALWSGEWTEAEFMDAMSTTIRSGMRQAYVEAGEPYNIGWEDRSDAEKAAYDGHVRTNLNAAPSLAAFIVENERGTGKLSRVFARLEAWHLYYDLALDDFTTLIAADQMFEWVWSPEKEHCEDCRRQNGGVHRGSIWQKYQILPKSRSLACHGYRCGCRLVPTTKRGTPGRPPALRG